jgi:hypothetical protein
MQRGQYATQAWHKVWRNTNDLGNPILIPSKIKMFGGKNAD